MGNARGTKTEGVGVQPHEQLVPGPRANGKGTEASCPDCGHPNARHEGSPEDEFVASHGGVGYAFCLEIDPSGERPIHAAAARLLAAPERRAI